MHITLTGNLGSGKSTLCRVLENKYGYEIYSTGKVQRTIAEEMGISVLEMNQLMRSDHKYDKKIDDAVVKISRENKEKNIVFDSRLAWHFVEESFKVFYSVSLDVAAMRVFHDNRGNVESYASIEDTKKQLMLRAQTENIRYKEIYNIEYFNFSNYDFVLDSTCCDPEHLAEVLLHEAAGHQMEKEAGKPQKVRILLSPERLGARREFCKYAENAYYPENVILIMDTEAGYVPADALAAKEIQKAADMGYPFIQAELA